MTELNKSLPWYSLPGNPYMQDIHPLMLNEDGYFILRAMKGAKPGEKNSVSIRYDRQFVIENIVNRIFSPLNGIPHELIFALLEEAYFYYQWGKEQNLPEGISDAVKRHLLRQKFLDSKILED